MRAEFFPYRLALDIGIASIGWVIYEINNKGNLIRLRDGNVVIFPTATGSSERRSKRSARKTNDRKQQRLRRIAAIMEKLGGYKHGQAPKEILNTSPFRLRSKALDRKLSITEIERLLLHMGKHRGTSAVRMTGDEETKKEGKAVLSAVNRTESMMTELNARTYGELLWRLEKKYSKPENHGNKLRISKNNTSAKDKMYAHYPTRVMLEEEFDRIMEKQKMFHESLLTDDVINKLRDELFYEREKRTPPPGFCMFVEGETRLPRLNRLSQTKRLYEEVNNLRISFDGEVRALTLEERDQLITHLMAGEKLTDTGIRKLLKLEAPNTVYLGRKRKINIEPYPFDTALSQPEILGAKWHGLSEEKQDALLDILATVWDERYAVPKMTSLLDCDDRTARNILTLDFPDGYTAMGRTATQQVLDLMKKRVISHQEALKELGLKERTFWGEERLKRLPYYGEILKGHVMYPDKDRDDVPERERQFGRISNNVIHRALIQCQRLINEIIRKYGPPTEIHIELSRDISRSEEERDEKARKIEENRKKNQKIRKEIRKLGLKPSDKNMALYKLFDRQKGQCAYTQTPIERAELFSGAWHIDHVLPQALTFDNTLSNKVVCTAQANLDKGDQSPYDAFAHSPRYDWAAIMRHVKENTPHMEWRFFANALDKFREESEDSFAPRALNDTRYIARLMRFYLSSICNWRKIAVTNGRITDGLRRAWGLDGLLAEASAAIQDDLEKRREEQKKKNKEQDEEEDGSSNKKNKVFINKRADHRHHFIDAVVIGSISRRLISEIQRLAKQIGTEGKEANFFREVFAKIPTPIDQDTLYQDVKNLLKGMVPYVKPNHKKQGQLHEETRYGLIGGPDKDGRYLCRQSKNVKALAKAEDLDKIRIQKTVLNLGEKEMDDPLPNLPDIERSIQKAQKRIEKIKDGIIRLYDRAEDKLLEDNEIARLEGKKTKEITEDEIFKAARDLYLEEPDCAKQYEIFSWKSLIVPAHATSGNQPRFGYVGGNNLRTDFYTDQKDKLQWECISRYDGMRESSKTDTFIPKHTEKGNRLLFSLYINDLIEMDDPDDPDERTVFAVIKISKGKLQIGPVLDARTKKGGRKTSGEMGLSFYQKHGAQKVVLDRLGQPKWKSVRLDRL